MKPQRVGHFGATGTGKTVRARQRIEEWTPARLIVWDFKHDPGLDGCGREVRDLAELCQAMKANTFALRYIVDHDGDIARQFDIFCRAAWLAGNLVMFVDEVPQVSAPGRAPKSWQKIVNIGREYRRHDGKIVGIAIIAAGQRPAECDKSFIANLDGVWCGRLGYEEDAKVMARKIGAQGWEWMHLMNLPDLHYVERFAGRDVEVGTLQFGHAAKKTAKPPKERPLDPKLRAKK